MEQMRKTIIIISIVLACLALMLFLSEWKPAETENLTEHTPAPPVTTLTVLPGSIRSSVQGFGELSALSESTVSSRTGGRIRSISEKLKPGSSVGEGEILIELEDTDYRAELAQAVSRLASAELALLTARQDVLEARENWERSGIEGDPQSALVLKLPQLKAAEADRDAAAALVEQAGKNLEECCIRAPYEGIISIKHASVGETLLPGAPAFSLFSPAPLELTLDLSQDQWALLEEPLLERLVLVTDMEERSRWKGRITRLSGMIDGETRLRKLYIMIDDPADGAYTLLPGSYVKAEIEGRLLNNCLKIPYSALTMDNLIWTADEENRLRSHKTKTLLQRKESLFVESPKKGEIISGLSAIPTKALSREE